MARTINEAVHAHVAAAKLPPPAFDLIPIEIIQPSPLNPRKRFDSEKHAELVESVRAKGVIVPVMVRPLSADESAPFIVYELVYGERRYRAAKEAGLTHLPVLVRSLEDREVVELGLAENVDRDDMSPIDEGAAYRKLVEMGRTVDEVAALVGKKRGTIYGRMKLAELQGAARVAVERDGLHATIGVLIARLPTPELQEEAFELLQGEVGYMDGGFKGLTYEAAENLLQDQFALKLKDAPFDTKDPNLVDGCGACTACPKRTGAQPELFKDVKHDTCLDRPCYQVKLKAHAATARVKITAQAEKKGLEVLPASALKDAGYVDLEKEVWDFNSDSEKKVKSLLGTHAPDPVAVVIDSEGRAHNLVKADDARKALKAAGKEDLVSRVAPKPSGDSDWEARQKKEREQQEFRRGVANEALTQIVAATEKSKETPASYLRTVIAWFGADHLVLERRGVKHERDLRAAAEKYSEAQLRGLLMELLLGRSALHVWSGYSTVLSEACDAFGIDLKALEKEQKQKAKEAEKAAKSAEKKAAPAKAKKGKAA